MNIEVSLLFTIIMGGMITFIILKYLSSLLIEHL